MTIRRVTPPKDYHEAWERFREAETIVAGLKALRARCQHWPHTRAYIGRCIKSAEGAVRHADNVRLRMQRRDSK